MFGFNFAPTGWAQCNGQLISISQNSALFALLGTFYGGDGTSNFALPDLQSRVAIHQGQGLGLSPYVTGQNGGAETVQLSLNQIPQHSHLVNASSSPGSTGRPAGAVPGRSTTDIYASAPDGSTTLHPSTIANAGGGAGHSNIQPYLTVNFCIALTGVFPSRS